MVIEVKSCLRGFIPMTKKYVPLLMAICASLAIVVLGLFVGYKQRHPYPDVFLVTHPDGQVAKLPGSPLRNDIWMHFPESGKLLETHCWHLADDCMVWMSVEEGRDYNARGGYAPLAEKGGMRFYLFRPKNESKEVWQKMQSQAIVYIRK